MYWEGSFVHLSKSLHKVLCLPNKWVMIAQEADLWSASEWENYPYFIKKSSPRHTHLPLFSLSVSHTHTCATLSVLSVSSRGDEWEWLYEILTGHLLLCSSVWELDVGPASLVPLWGHLLGMGTREVSRRGPCHPGRPAQKTAPPWGSIHPTCWVTEHQSSPTCQINVHATRAADM